MSYCHHMITLNGASHYDLESTLAHSRDLVSRLLSRLDGKERYSLVLGPLPAGQGLADVDVKKWPIEYIQSAGSSEAMTVELRDGLAHQYVVGRTSQKRSEQPDVDIPWDDFVTTVYEDEVFDADEATVLFAHYLAHGSVRSDYALREIGLDKQQ